jgi:hypothetical protein
MNKTMFTKDELKHKQYLVALSPGEEYPFSVYEKSLTNIEGAEFTKRLAENKEFFLNNKKERKEFAKRTDINLNEHGEFASEDDRLNAELRVLIKTTDILTPKQALELMPRFDELQKSNTKAKETLPKFDKDQKQDFTNWFVKIYNKMKNYFKKKIQNRDIKKPVGEKGVNGDKKILKRSGQSNLPDFQTLKSKIEKFTKDNNALVKKIQNTVAKNKNLKGLKVNRDKRSSRKNNNGRGGV